MEIFGVISHLFSIIFISSTLLISLQEIIGGKGIFLKPSGIGNKYLYQLNF